MMAMKHFIKTYYFEKEKKKGMSSNLGIFHQNSLMCKFKI